MHATPEPCPSEFRSDVVAAAQRREPRVTIRENRLRQADVEAAAALHGIATSAHPFDVWFREHLATVDGMDLSQGMTLARDRPGLPRLTHLRTTMAQGRARGPSSGWRCRASNPGPCRPFAFFYVCSRAIASRPPRFVRHYAVAAQSLFGFPPAPVTGAIGESPSDVSSRFGDASG
jgi:hypothetical protein